MWQEGVSNVAQPTGLVQFSICFLDKSIHTPQYAPLKWTQDF